VVPETIWVNPLRFRAQDRTFLAVGDRVDARRINAERDQIILHDRSAALAKGEVVFTRAALVAVAGDHDADRRVGLQPGGLQLQDFLIVGVQTVFVEVKIDALTDVHAEIFQRTRCRASRLFDHRRRRRRRRRSRLLDRRCVFDRRRRLGLRCAGAEGDKHSGCCGDFEIGFHSVRLPWMS
jgi:hypothetical protein